MQFRLFLRAAAEGVGAEVDLLIPSGDPDNRVSVLPDANLSEMLRVLQAGKDAAAFDDGPEIDYTGVAIIPLDLQDTLDDGLCRKDSGDFAHAMLPGLWPAAHASHAALN
jgi:hypothetical protein